MKTNNLSKIILLLFGIIITLSFGVSSVAAAHSATAPAPNTLYVNTTGNDNNNGSSWQHAKATITNATGTIANNGIIYITDGTYNEFNIKINTNMTIIGKSRTGTIINAKSNGNIFNIAPGVTLTLENLTLKNGYSTNGGAIYNCGNLIVNNCVFTGNNATFGGAIYNYADQCNAATTITSSTFTGNTATTAGGAIFNSGSKYNATITITSSTFTGNSAKMGGAIINMINKDSNATTTLTSSTFTGNTAANGFGGAIANTGDLTVKFCRIAGNNAQYGTAIFSTNPRSAPTNPSTQPKPTNPSTPTESEQSLNIENNWWGSNHPDFSSLISGIANPAHWLYMTITAKPTTINNAQTSLITASFNNLYNGNTVTPLNPTVGHIPDGSPVNFQTNLGTIDCKSADKITANGIATAILTANELPGIANLNATTDNQTLFANVTINPKSNLYLTVTPSKTNPVAGDTVVYTLKVGNNGPDTAKNVVMTYVIPEGLEFAGAKVDVGEWKYDASTRTITWTIGDVPVGDPYMWISLRVAQPGQYLINPALSTSTYNSTINVQSIKIHATAQTNVNTLVNAATVTTKTIGMQKTGIPLPGLVLAILAVFGGLVAPRRK